MNRYLFLGLVFIVLSCECIENNNSKNIFNFKETDLKYYELVHEDPLCETTCMNEYIVHSNGLVFIKRVHKGNCVDIEIGTINETMAISLIERAESIISDRKTGGINCTDCGVYHIFYGDSEKTTELTIYLRDAPISVMELENDTSNALNDLKPIEQFFVQFIYKKPWQYTFDYHFYPDGTVLLEEFGEKNGELVSSAIYTINQEDVNFLRDSVTDDYFSSTNNLKNCLDKDLEWGALAIKKGNKYNLVYTCGGSSSTADRLFDELLERIGNG